MSNASSVRLLRIVRCNGFEQLERCGSHNLDSQVKRAMSDDENQHSDFPDLVPDASDDEEEQSEKEDEVKEEEEEEEFDLGTASGTDASLLGRYLIVFLHALILIYFAVGEEIDSDEFQSNGYQQFQSYGFDKDCFDGSGPTVRVRRLPAVVSMAYLRRRTQFISINTCMVYRRNALDHD